MKKKKGSRNSIKFNIQHDRPEEINIDSLKHFDYANVKKYAESKSIMRIQERISERVLELADLNEKSIILDIGMGCGFASTYFYFQGFRVVGLDLNWDFITYYQ